MAIRIQLRRDTAANWVSSNPVLRAGEIGIETDTLKFKIGNGSSTWTAITSYANVTPSGLTNSLGSYILTSSQGSAGGPAELDSNGDLVVPENSIILWNDDNYTYTTTLTATQPTADRTITIPNSTGTVALTSDLNSYAALSGATFTGNIQIPTTVTFEGATADSYETSLVATDPTADRTITLPDRDGTVITSGDTGTVTNTMLAGSIANDKLANSSITINGFPISLGGTASYGTDNIGEGTTNLYFTDERAQDAVATALSNGSHTNITVSYNDNSNAISLTGAVTYTDENAQDAIGNAVGNGLDYDDSTGAISVDPSEFTLNSVGVPSANIDLNTYKITNLGTPTSDSDAATKAYVDASTAGLNVHASVKVATTTNVNLNQDLESGDVIDGVTLANNDRVLVKNQNAPEHNGIYVVQNSGAAIRANDYNSAGEVDAGDFIFVESGTVNSKTGWIQTNTITTLDTDHIAFTQFSGAGTYSAGTGLTLTGNSFSINTATTVDLNTAQTLTNKTITGTFTGNLTGNVTGNADTVTNGVVTTGTYSNPSWITGLAWSKISSTPTTISGYGITDPIVLTSGSYADPAWITSLAASKVGLGNVENTALSTWAGSANITTLGTVSTGTWNATAIGATKGGTGLTSYATGDIVYASATNTLSKLAAGTDGYLLTLSSGVPTWAAAPISLPAQSGSTVGKYLQSDGTSASWQSLVVPITTGTATLTANTANTIDTNALSGFTSIEYMVSLKQGSKVRTSKVVMQTDGTSVDMTEFAITETGGTIAGVVVSAAVSSTNGVLQVTATDATSTNVDVKFSKVKL